MDHHHMTGTNATDGYCSYDGFHSDNGLADPPCFEPGQFVLLMKQEAHCPKCGAEHLPVNLICCERHAHQTLEKLGMEIKSVLPVHQDSDKLKYEMDKKLEEMLG